MSGVHRILLLSALLLGSAAPTALATDTCSTFNAQSRAAAEGLARELQIANAPLSADDLAAGHNPKLAAYLAQFSPDAIAHGMQGRPEPTRIADLHAHYALVMSSPSQPGEDPDGGLVEDLVVVAGPMAAHRYHATLNVPGFPPDFAYYDPALPLRLRGQTVFDYGAHDGQIRERWSNHDNKFRTGQLWRYMLANPQRVDPARFRQDLHPGSDTPGGLIDRDGDRLNAVFNGELALRPGDFSLRDGAFVYGTPEAPDRAEAVVPETEGLAFVRRWFGPQAPAFAAAGSSKGWLAHTATLHGAGCDDAAAASLPAQAGGPGAPGAATATLQALLGQRLGEVTRIRLLQSVSDDTPYAELPVSAWSRVAFQTELTSAQMQHGARMPPRYCAQWVMRLGRDATAGSAVVAEEVWLDLKPLSPSVSGCEDILERE
jgi:hypothetical protein